MKKLAIFTLSVFAGISALAQGTTISSAKIALDAQRFQEAVDYIEEARRIVDEKKGDVDDKQMSKYYFYKAEIYRKIALSSSEEVKAINPDAAEISADNYLKLLDFEKTHKERYSDESKEALPYVLNKLGQIAFQYNNDTDFKGAAAMYMKIYNIKKNPILGDIAKIDTTTYFNAGVLSLNAEDTAQAIKVYQEIVDLGYKGKISTATSVETGDVAQFANKAQMMQYVENGSYKDPKTSESQLPNFYGVLINLYNASGEKEKGSALLDQAAKKFPKNQIFINMQINSYLADEKYDEAIKVIEMSVASNPDTTMYYNAGVIYQNQIKDLDKAEQAFDKCLELNPKYYDAIIAKALLYLTRSNEMVAKINELGLNETTKYKKYKAEKLEIDKKALAIFEQAYEMKPDDKDVIQYLAGLYANVGDQAKSDKFYKMLK